MYVLNLLVAASHSLWMIPRSRALALDGTLYIEQSGRSSRGRVGIMYCSCSHFTTCRRVFIRSLTVPGCIFPAVRSDFWVSRKLLINEDRAASSSGIGSSAQCALIRLALYR